METITKYLINFLAKEAATAYELHKARKKAADLNTYTKGDLNTKLGLTITLKLNGKSIIDLCDIGGTKLDFLCGYNILLAPNWSERMIKLVIEDTLRRLKPVTADNLPSFEIYVQKYDLEDIINELRKVPINLLTSYQGADFGPFHVSLSHRGKIIKSK